MRVLLCARRHSNRKSINGLASIPPIKKGPLKIMAETRLMRADEIATGFNSVTERQYWRASVAGTRLSPEVHFNSRSSMVRIAYHISDERFTVSFSKTAAAFGDYLASTYRSLVQVLTCLQAAGLPFAMPVGDATNLRLVYDPGDREMWVMIHEQDDGWEHIDPLPFKVPERNGEEKLPDLLDGL